MTDRKQPETLQDADLDTVRGGSVLMTNENIRSSKRKDGIIWADSSDGDGVKGDEPRKLLGDDFGY